MGFEDIKKDQRRSSRLQSLKLKCQNHEEGCPWVGVLKDYKKHLNKDCKYMPKKAKECQCQAPKGPEIFTDLCVKVNQAAPKIPCQFNFLKSDETQP